MHLPTGSRLGRYEILGFIGAGGMGEVYRARDHHLDRTVAIKILADSGSADDTAHRRLIHEARSAAALNHPNICTVFDSGTEEGHTYVAMECVDGEPLVSRLVNSRLPVNDVLRYGIQLADALAHAHDHGVLHRDLKPGNVMITPENNAKILDFGLAKRTADNEGTEMPTVPNAMLTSPGTVFGTLAYMAPEQLRGRSADARSDIWALGVILHEMASGARPFDGDTWPAIAAAILTETPKPLPGDAPIELQPVISRCMAKQPGERYQRAGEVRAALLAIQEGTSPVPMRRRRLMRRHIAAFAGTLVLAATVAGVCYLKERPQRAAKPITSVAVLPLENLSGDPEQEFIADGIHEALITELSRSPKVEKVIARSSVMQYRKTDKPLHQVARELGVDAIITGSVLRSGTRVQVTAHLVRARDEEHLWAEKYEREVRDVLSLQNEIVAAIALKTELQLTPRERTGRGAGRVDPEAYRLYLMGRHHWERRTPEGYLKAAEYFEQAIDKDPTYAAAYAGLADNYAVQPGADMLMPAQGYPRAEAAAMKALQLDDTLAEPYATLGLVRAVWEWDWKGAEQAYRKSLQLNPNYATAHHWYAWYLCFLGRTDESIAEMKRARELDPLSAIIATNVAETYYHARRYEEATAAMRRTVEVDPDFAEAHATMGRVRLAAGHPEEAAIEFERAHALLPSLPGHELNLAEALIALGRAQEAQNILQRVEKMSGDTFVPAFELAIVHAKLLERDRAFYWLEKSVDRHEREAMLLKVEPRLDPLRDDLRFAALLRKMNFPPSAK